MPGFFYPGWDAVKLQFSGKSQKSWALTDLAWQEASLLARAADTPHVTAPPLFAIFCPS